MKKLFLFVSMAFVFCFVPLTGVNAATLYVDDDLVTPCGGNTPCYPHPQDAVNAANPGDTILVYPGTYGTRYYPDCGWADCGCGDTSAPALIVYRDSLTIQATGSAAATIIESTHQCWSNAMPVTKSTGLIPDFGTAPNGVSIIANGVTIDGFTIRSEYLGDPNSGNDWPNTAGIMIGALYAGDKPPIGVTDTTVKNCVISGHSGIYNWRASDTTIEGNTLTILQSPYPNTHNGNGIAIWDGYYEGTFGVTSTGVRILNNNIDTTMLTSGGEGNGIMFGGTDSTTAGADQSGMLIDGNIIHAYTDGIKFWHSVGSNKLITCDNDVTFGTSGAGYRAYDRSDGAGPASTWTEDPYPCPPYQACESNMIVNWNFEDGNQGFVTNYEYIDPTNTGTWTLGPEKTYTVSTDPNLYHSAWTSFGDHTSGTGKMMIINARRSDQGAGEVIWGQTVPVAPNTNYTFSYWIALSHPDNPPRLEILINGVVVGTQDMATPGTNPRIGPTGEWVQVKYDWFSDDETSATIQFVDATVEAWGDDFVLDDIELCGTPCLGGGGGLTLGFWSNKNGQKLFGADDLALMVSLNLRNANGSNFNPGSYSAFRTWLLNASATNMAYMLSAQLAAMELNVFNGKVDGDAWIYAPGTTSASALGYATVNAVMAEANTELGLHGLTTAGSPYRAYQEALKNALDKANNNYNFVIPCP